jgi:hypothetical protein
MIHMKKMGLVIATIRVCSNLVIASNWKVSGGAQTVDILAARALAIVSISVIGFLITVLIACSPVPLENHSLDDFAAAFRTANQAKNLNPMLQLYATNGADKEQLTALKGALEYELGLPIESIQFHKYTNDADAQIDYTYQGVPYGPSLPPKILMQVQYSTNDRFMSRFTLGQTEAGSWRIICARPTQPTIHRKNP